MVSIKRTNVMMTFVAIDFVGWLSQVSLKAFILLLFGISSHSFLTSRVISKLFFGMSLYLI